METFLIRALQLMLSLSLLVIIHEGGHFLFAKLFKVRVNKFYLFFNRLNRSSANAYSFFDAGFEGDFIIYVFFEKFAE